MQLNETNKPWHKYPLVWMMFAIPFSAVIMGVVMIWLALDTDDGLVADDYYKQGLAINDVISLDKKAAELQLKAIIEFDGNGKVVLVKLDKGLLARYPDTLLLSFQHATHADSDVAVILNHGIEDQYIGYLDNDISEGVWYFEISDKSRADSSRSDKSGSDKSVAEISWKLNARSYLREKNIIQLQSNY